jgi:4-carboxymuconolactone decarboxylase
MSTRLPPLPREDLNEEQQHFYDDFRATVNAKSSHPGAADRASRTLFPVLAVLPKSGRLSVDLLAYLEDETRSYLPEDARETACLVTTTFFKSVYVTYAHKMMAVKLGLLTQEQADAMTDGRRPDGLSERCGVAYDFSRELLEVRGAVREELWERAVGAFGKEGAVGLMHYVSLLAWTSMGLNVADVPAPPAPPSATTVTTNDAGEGGA